MQALLECQIGYKILIPLIFSVVFLIFWIVRDEIKLRRKDRKINELQDALDLSYRLHQASTNQDKEDLKRQNKIMLDHAMLGHVVKKKMQ